MPILSVLTLLVLTAHASVLHRRDGPLEWAALGDSYASGVGSERYIDGRRCLRYDQSYPRQLDADPRFVPDGEVSIFQNCACSGSESVDVSAWQLSDQPLSTGTTWQYGIGSLFAVTSCE